jgi:hypothetical protein
MQLLVSSMLCKNIVLKFILNVFYSPVLQNIIYCVRNISFCFRLLGGGGRGEV